MSSGYIFLPVEGGGGGTGNILSINGDTSANQFINAGTGISIVSGGGITTITNSAPLLPVPGNSPSFAFWVDPTGDLSVLPGWNYYTNTLGMNVILDQSVDNTGGYTVHNLQANLIPTLASPTSTYNFLNVQATVDPTSTGFAIGTNGSLGTLISSGFTLTGTGDTGTLTLNSSYSNIGNGTDPIDVGGYYGYFIFGDINDNVNLSRGFQGYIFQPHAHSAATTSTGTTFSTIFGDFANIECEIDGWNSYAANPQIASIRNNNNYQGFNLNPTITTFLGNSGFNGFSCGGTVTTMSPTGYMNGFAFNTNITTSHGTVSGFSSNPTIAGGDADVTLYSGSLSQVTGTSTNLSVLQLGGLTADGKEAGASIDGVRFSVSGTMVAQSGQTIQSQHVLFTAYSTPDSTAITGTDVLMNILSPDVNFGNAGSSVALGPSGLGVNMVAFAGQCHGHGQMDQLNALTAGAIFMDDFTVGEWRGVNSLLINAGYTGTTTNATGFYHEVGGAGVFATNHWGVKIASDIDNSMYKLAINTPTGKVSNASVGLEIGGTDRAFLLPRLTNAEEAALTAVDGMMIYNTDLGKFRGYEAGSWVNLI